MTCVDCSRSRERDPHAPLLLTCCCFAILTRSSPDRGPPDPLQVVRGEYEQLCSDHAGIIKMGERFGTFDPLGKLAFLDQLESVESRWDVFYSRFELLGQLNPDFATQTNGFLESMGMSAEIFRETLSDAHKLMREEAEKER